MEHNVAVHCVSTVPYFTLIFHKSERAMHGFAAIFGNKPPPQVLLVVNLTHLELLKDHDIPFCLHPLDFYPLWLIDSSGLAHGLRAFYLLRDYCRAWHCTQRPLRLLMYSIRTFRSMVGDSENSGYMEKLSHSTALITWKQQSNASQFSCHSYSRQKGRQSQR